MGRAPCCEKVGLKKGKWTAEEDEILTKYIQANGEGSWRSLPKNAGLLRCGKSCRLRWINYLRTDLKRGNISVEEESLIAKLHASFGNRWSLIASHLPARTDNEIKNYWNSHLSRKIYTFKGSASNEDAATTTTTLPRILNIPPKRRGGRTSRWAMKKNKTYALKTKLNNNHKESPKQSHQSVVTHPLPPAASLECENLTMVMDFMALDPEREDEEVGDGSSKSNSQQEKVNGGGSVVQEQYCAVEEDARINDILCIDGEKEKSSHDILREYQKVINGGGELSFNEIMNTCFLEEASGVLSIESDNNSNNEVVGNGAAGNEPTCTTNLENSVDQRSNGESGELRNCSSMSSGLDDSNDNSDWDWESVIQLNGNHDDVTESLEKKKNLLNWLWEDDDDWGKDCYLMGDIKSELDVMVAWFSS